MLRDDVSLNFFFFLAIVIYELFSTQGDQNTMTLTEFLLQSCAHYLLVNVYRKSTYEVQCYFDLDFVAYVNESLYEQESKRQQK